MADEKRTVRSRKARFRAMLEQKTVQIGDKAFPAPPHNGLNFTNKRPLVLGIDPGYGGALALFNPTSRKAVKLKSMPLTNYGRCQKEILLTDLAFFLEEWVDQIAFAVMEKVAARPEQGVASMFRFGMGYGKLRGLLAANYIPTHLVLPQAWKGAMHLINKEKAWSRVMAIGMFPDVAHEFQREKDDGKAEALLIAVYGALYCDRAFKPAGV